MAEGAATYLLFVTKTTGYELAVREGEAPGPGCTVELDNGGGRFTVAKVAASPLPGDGRRCAYLVPV